MKQILIHTFNKAKQYMNRMFYACTNNTLVLHYAMLFNAISQLEIYISKKTKDNPISIIVISNNVLFKTIVFVYGFFTGTNILLISPKFSITEIVNTILSLRSPHWLFVDQNILSKIKTLEEEEHINILSFFKHIETTSTIMSMLLESEDSKALSTIVRKGSKKYNENDYSEFRSLSPGTSSLPAITHIPYKLLGESMKNLEFFMGLKPTDKISVIADFEFYPGLYTILGLLTGIEYVLPETDDTENGAVIQNNFALSDHKANVLFITSNNFKLIWDNIILTVYSMPFVFILSKFYLTKWIVTRLLLREISRTFGKQMKKVHILNEELGFTVLDILKKSKIMFTSSYGFLEQGNFLVFKDPELFKHKDFIYKPGGTVLKDTHINIEGDLGQIEFNVQEEDTWRKAIRPGDIGKLIKNVPNQGDRQYLYVYANSYRYTTIGTGLSYSGREIKPLPSLDLIEKSIKDNWLIRDCMLQRHFNTSGEALHTLTVEIREDLLDSKQVPESIIEDIIKSLAVELDRNSSIKIDSVAIIRFDGMRNIVGKLQYYLI